MVLLKELKEVDNKMIKDLYIVKDNQQHIYGLNSEQRSLIEESLTFNNPAYANAKRYGRSRYISIPPYLTYYSEHSVKVTEGERKKVLTVPIGIDVEKVIDVKGIHIRDERTSNKVSYPPFVLDLRDIQVEAEAHYLLDVKRNNYPKCVTQLPTGKGKSILALHTAYTLQEKTLILVHKDDLVVGWQKDINLCFGDDIDIGLIKAKSRKIGEQITIATVQTLSRMNEDEFSNLVNEFGFVVQDECHHVGLNIFNIINRFNSKYKLGLSATPKRSDGLDFVFDLFFGGIGYKYEAGADDEDICSVKVKVLDSKAVYRPFYFNGQVFNEADFKKEELPSNITYVEDMDYTLRPKIPYLTIDDSAVKNENTLKMVCEKIIKYYYNSDYSILVLFTQKDHIRLYGEYLKQYIPEEKVMYYYGDSNESSEEMMKKAENKEVSVTLATYAKATEGTNVKAWEVLFLVSSLNNEKNVEQAIGRIRRRKAGKINPVIVYDVRYSGCYSLRRHYDTRLRVYRRLKFQVESRRALTGKKSLFSRGYH